MRPSPDTTFRSLRRHTSPDLILGLPPAEVADYGLGPIDLRRLAELPPEQIGRRNAMARLNGLDPARLEADRALDIATALCCAACDAQSGCGLAVAEGLLPESSEFCANAETYRTLAGE